MQNFFLGTFSGQKYFFCKLVLTKQVTLQLHSAMNLLKADLQGQAPRSYFREHFVLQSHISFSALWLSLKIHVSVKNRLVECNLNWLLSKY